MVHSTKCRFIILLFLTIVGFRLTAKEKNSTYNLSLEQCIEILLNQNLTIKNQQISITQQQFEVQNGIANSRPQVGADISFTDHYQVGSMLLPGEEIPVSLGPNIQTLVTLHAEQSLFNKSSKTNIQLQRERVKLTSTELDQIKEDLIYKTCILFYAVCSTIEMQKVIDEQNKIQTSIMEETKIRILNGFSLETDLQQMQVELLDIKSKNSSLHVEKTNLLNQLKSILNININDTVTLNNKHSQEVLSLKHEQLTSELKSVIKIQQQKRVDSISILHIKAMRYPKISLFANYGAQNLSLDINGLTSSPYWSDIGSVGIKLTIPIYTSGKTRNQITQRKLEYEKHQVQQVISDVETAYSNAIAKFKASQTDILLAKQKKILSKQVLDVSYQKYKQGKIVVNDLLQSQEKLLENNVIYTQKEFELQTAKLEVLYYEGRITEITQL
ncbi:TolC family protein [Halosquirtibacter xylanolyticus]|uniref:TolC family protein n=1 Tax=Halosquirtibacter xylanolyticus TaxID=3374599 RepID=UPI0037481577|nr:TolC family protein [Prolixibacteraceae bacterium]